MDLRENDQWKFYLTKLDVSQLLAHQHTSQHTTATTQMSNHAARPAQVALMLLLSSLPF